MKKKSVSYLLKDAGENLKVEKFHYRVKSANLNRFFKNKKLIKTQRFNKILNNFHTKV